MARPINKQGFRPVVVDNVRYRWRSDYHNRTADIEVHLESPSSVRGQRLCANLKCNLPSAIVTARLVSAIIASALAEGWQPNQVAPDYVAHVVNIQNDGSIAINRVVSNQ